MITLQTTLIIDSLFYAFVISVTGWHIRIKFFSIFCSWNYYTDLFFRTLLIYVAIEIIYWASKTFDEMYDWIEQPDKRFWAILLVGGMFPTLWLFWANFIYYNYTNRDLLHDLAPRYQFPNAELISILVNAYYIIVQVLEKLKRARQQQTYSYDGRAIGEAAPMVEDITYQEVAEKQPELDTTVPPKPISISIGGGRTILLTKLAIVYIVMLKGAGLEIKVRNLDHVSDPEAAKFVVYFDSNPLTRMYEQLDHDNYYKISRYQVVARDVVIGLGKRDKDRTSLILSVPHEEEFTISNKEVPQFKEWLGQTES